MRELKGIGYGWRHFPHLHNNQIQDLSERQVVIKISLEQECWRRLKQEYLICDREVLMTYQANLKSVMAVWDIWSNTINASKLTIVGTVFGSVLGVALANVRLPKFNLSPSHIWYLDAIAIPIEFAVIALMGWLWWAPARVMRKVERATFVLVLLDEVIAIKRQEGSQKDVAVANDDFV